MNPIKPAILALSLLSLAACSGSKKEQPKLDYQSQNRKVVNLEVPPDLTNPGQNSLYQLPAGSGAVRASDINRNRATNQPPGGQTVLAGVSGVKMERDGSQRWLNVSGKKPAELWPLLKTFWQESGFTIASEEPAIGQMETDWAENRAKLSGGGLRSLLEKIGLGGVYSTSERDKFIIRIEQAKNGGTDIFFAHKGMSETYTDRSEERTMWQPRPNEPPCWHASCNTWVRTKNKSSLNSATLLLPNRLPTWPNWKTAACCSPATTRVTGGAPHWH